MSERYICEQCKFEHHTKFIWCPKCKKLQSEYNKTIGAGMNKVGDEVVNGAGNLVKVKKECLKCQTFTKQKGHGKYKCCVKSSCPGWTPPTQRVRRRRRGYK